MPLPTNSSQRDPDAARQFLRALYGHDALRGLWVGTSKFPPKTGVHAWHETPETAASWAIENSVDSNAYFRTTPVADPPKKGRAAATAARAIVGFHADTDYLHAAHKGENLPPNAEAAMDVVRDIGLKPTIVVNSGHGLQSHFLLTEPWVFGCDEDREGATSLSKRFQKTLRAAALRRGGWSHDSVGDLARVLRVPGTMNFKAEPVPVTILEEGGPRYKIQEIENVLINTCEPRRARAQPGELRQSVVVHGFPGNDDELLVAARAAHDGEQFAALFDRGETAAYGGDASRADWHLVKCFFLRCGPDPDRIDRLFRRSKLMRPKWDERHAANGNTYGQMTIAAVLSKSASFHAPPGGLPMVIVSGRQLREETKEALAAIAILNRDPVVFQLASDIVRVRIDELTKRPVIQRVAVDEMTGILARSANFATRSPNRKLRAVRPPQAIARDILALPAWEFPPLLGVAEAPRVRPDGSVLVKPGYDASTKLWLAQYEGCRTFSVPGDPTAAEVAESIALIEELIGEFPFVQPADRANTMAFMLTPVLRPAISGSVPVCCIDALSKQGTGKSLLLRACMIAATGRDPALSAIPDEEAEWRKSITAALAEGREVVAFDNAAGAVVESGTWANAVTAGVYDDRILGATKRGQFPVRCTWAITGNGLCFGPDMARRAYRVMLDAVRERPDERTGFRHELPGWALDNRAALLRACLILCRAYWSQGCPKPRVHPMGSFETWTTTVGGVLANAGVEGFLVNQANFRDSADVDRSEWQAFAKALAEAFDTVVFSTSDVLLELDRSPALAAALPAWLAETLKEKSFGTRLGKALRKHAGAIFGEWRLEELGKHPHTKKPRYRVVGHG